MNRRVASPSVSPARPGMLCAGGCLFGSSCIVSFTDVCTMKIPAHGVYANVLSQILRSPMSLPLLHIDQAACTANDTYKITICQETKRGG